MIDFAQHAHTMSLQPNHTFIGITMARDATYQLRLDEETKRESFAVFHELGMTPAEGMRIFLSMVAKTRSIPFSINIPNLQTQQALAESSDGKGVTHFDSEASLFQHLDSLTK